MLLYAMMLSCFSRVRLFATPRTVAHQAPLSMGFSSRNSGVGCHSLLWGFFLSQGWNSSLLHWQVDSLPSEPAGKTLPS